MQQQNVLSKTHHRFRTKIECILKKYKFQEKGKKTIECGKSGEDVEIASMLKGILDSKKLKYKHLEDLIDENDMVGFYEELERLGISDNQISQLKKNFLWNGADFKYANQLKVWLMDRFKKD